MVAILSCFGRCSKERKSKGKSHLFSTFRRDKSTFCEPTGRLTVAKARVQICSWARCLQHREKVGQGTQNIAFACSARSTSCSRLQGFHREISLLATNENDYYRETGKSKLQSFLLLRKWSGFQAAEISLRIFWYSSARGLVTRSLPIITRV